MTLIISVKNIPRHSHFSPPWGGRKGFGIFIYRRRLVAAGWEVVVLECPRSKQDHSELMVSRGFLPAVPARRSQNITDLLTVLSVLSAADVTTQVSLKINIAVLVLQFLFSHWPPALS